LAHDPRPEAELIACAQEGDREAYAELVRRYQDVAVATAFLVLRERQDAEDAVQEAFTNAFLALRRFRPDGSFRAWLLRIVANEARTIRGAARRRAELASRASSPPSISPAPSAEAGAMAQERREALLRALLELPESDRLVVTYRYFFDLGEAEMAEVLGVARGTIKSRLSRALAHLRPILRGFGPLVVVGPAFDDLAVQAFQELRHTPLGQPAPDLSQAALGHLKLAGGGSRLHQAMQHALSTTTVTVVGAVVAAALVAAQARSLLTERARPPAPAQQVIAYGGDLSDAERQELDTMFRARGDASLETVSRQELVDTLGSAPTDEAISSAALTCGDPSAGIKVRTEHVTRVPAAAYAGALLTVGLQGASAMVAAPSDKPVSGETGLLGLLKGVPTCLGHPVDPRRLELAYQQLDLLSSLAGNAGDLADTSELLLRMLNDVLRGTPPDVVVETEAVGLDDGQRAAAIAFLDQLHGLSYGPYGGGFRAAVVDGAYGILPPG
jgi:RNA polymerase sigma-70 factor (ECF subfamily)